MAAPLGQYKMVLFARTTDKEILRGAQNGGIVTALLSYALDTGIIDGAVVAAPSRSKPWRGKFDPWRSEPIVAMTRDQLLSARKTGYNISPNVMMIKEATRSYGLDRVGIVGVPCQIQGVRKAQLYPIGMRGVPDKIALVIGIYCMEVFPYQSIVQIVEDHGGVKMESVEKIEIGKGNFTVVTERGRTIQIPLNETRDLEQPGCHVCLDYAATLADISTGSAGSPAGWSTVFIRTKIGDEVWKRAMQAGLFETKPIGQVEPGLGAVEKLAVEKITRNKKTLEDRDFIGTKGLRNPYITT
ncbi:MAG: coenzyme F420 hydrogenase subunit beta [Methanomicrobiales archaeon]|nr:coenzyme F420 hydrogenase subunit beta [Methanomicrobiales archaeon]